MEAAVADTGQKKVMSRLLGFLHRSNIWRSRKRRIAREFAEYEMSGANTSDRMILDIVPDAMANDTKDIWETETKTDGSSRRTDTLENVPASTSETAAYIEPSINHNIPDEEKKSTLPQKIHKVEERQFRPHAEHSAAA